MKFISALIAAFYSLACFAQTPPEAFNYSGAARDAGGMPISEKTIGVELSILKGSPTGAVEYRERHFVNTDKFGVFNCTVGQGSVQQGTFSDVNWSNDSYYLRVGLDANGGSNFVVLGTTQLLSVPYALYAKSSGSSISTFLPTVITTNPFDFSFNSASSGGTVLNDYNNSVQQRGICWSTSQNPTISNSKTVDGSGLGTFISALTGLSPNTTYYIRAYAINDNGTAYGNQVSFKTTTQLLVPTVITSATTNVSLNSAISGGNITNNGGSFVSARGVCWSTTPNPTLSNKFTSNGIGDGLFSSSLDSLNPNTTYYVRAYATNSVGTAYGNQMTFKTDSLQFTSGSGVTDVDGNTYGSIILGNGQEWLSQNLKVSRFKDGSAIPALNSVVFDSLSWANYRNPAWSYYQNNPSFNNPFGKLYNWYTIDDSRGICPTGWHVPSKLEWESLVNYLGGQSIAGGKMKSIGTQFWQEPNTGANNQSGFSGLPGGAILDYNWSAYINAFGVWWSTTETTSVTAEDFSLGYNTSASNGGSVFKQRLHSVRCLKD